MRSNKHMFHRLVDSDRIQLPPTVYDSSIGEMWEEYQEEALGHDTIHSKPRGPSNHVHWRLASTGRLARTERLAALVIASSALLLSCVHAYRFKAD